MPILSYVLNDAADSQIVLTEIGHEINNSIQYIDENYVNMNVTKYVIMPNHIHMIVWLESLYLCGDHPNIPLQTVIGQFKSFTTMRFNEISGAQHDKL